MLGVRPHGTQTKCFLPCGVTNDPRTRFVVQGLGGTLFLLGLYQKALPALPISILLSVMVYFWLRMVFVDFVSSALSIGVLL